MKLLPDVVSEGPACDLKSHFQGGDGSVDEEVVNLVI
jgi:hypothetical protein